jgi:5-methylthioadenosine/S-adenosylhomocysteine deaminase
MIHQGGKTTMATTLIRNGLVLTMDTKLGTLYGGDVLIEDDRIAAVGEELPAKGCEVIDASDMIVMPGFVDGHRHMYAGMLRGTGNDDYKSYFPKVVLGIGGSYTPEDTYISSRLGTLESIDTGITTLHAWDHNMISPAHADASLRAMRESGLRLRFSYGPDNQSMRLNHKDVLRMRDEVFTRYEGGRYWTPDGNAFLGIATRGIENNDREVYLADYEFARKNGLPITAHFMEKNVEQTRDDDVLGPDVLPIHLNGASPEDMAHVARSGSPVVIAPIALARVGEKASDIPALMKAGIKLGISVDSVSGADCCDFFAQMKFALCMWRSNYRNAMIIQPLDILRMATCQGAEVVGLGDVTGSLTPGKKADLILLRTTDINFTPVNNPVMQVVMSGQPSNVDTVFIDGVCRKRAGQLVGVDVREVAAAVQEAVAGIAERVGYPVN